MNMKKQVYKSTGLQGCKLEKFSVNLSASQLVNLPVLLLVLALTTSCSDKDDKKPVLGKSFYDTKTQKLDPQEVEEAVSGFFSQLPTPIKNDYWPRNGYIPGENLAFSEGKHDYDASSAGSEPKPGLGITSAPVIAEGKIFTLGGKGELQARSMKDISEVLWETKIDTRNSDKDYLSTVKNAAKSLFTDESEFIGGNICYSLGNIFVATKRGYVFVFNAKDGAPLWSKNLGVTIRSTPVVREDKLVFITSDNRTIAINTKDGSPLWQHQGLPGSSKVMSSPAPLLIGNKLIVTYSSGEIFALDFNSGIEIWNGETSKSSYGMASSFMNDISYNPVYHKGVIYIISSDGTLNALDENGKSLWTFEGEVINKSIWPVEDFLFTTTRFGDIIAISARSGKLIWKNKMAPAEQIDEDDLQFTGLVMAGGRLYAADNNGTLYSYSSKNGDTMAKESIPENVELTPVVADGKVFLITKKSKLIIVR